MMEAALLAASGYKGKVDYTNPRYFGMISELVNTVGLRPQLQELN